MRTVSEVSALTGVTVRALHHYDEIGLLPPSDRSPAGYRLYGDDEVERLHEVLLWRELGFGLDEIADLLDDPAHDRQAALCRQRERLVVRARRLDAMLAAVDAAITARGKGTAMTDDEIRAIFGADADLFGTEEYAREAHDRWGDTDAWRESAARAADLTPDDWRRIKAEGDELDARFVALLTDGVPTDGPRAAAAAEAHRAQISRWYDCPPAMHQALADLYVDDPRFTAYYERRAPGLAAYVRDAIHAAHA